MTVAAVVLAPPAVIALMTPEGGSVVRAVADAALAGGATPIVVVSPDPDGPLAAALAGSAAEIAAPPPGTAPGIAWFAFGLSVALAEVSGTTGALLWPGRHAWVDPETVTSLLERHGVRPDAILRPAYGGEPGFPTLLPVACLPALGGFAGLHGPEAIERLIASGVPFELLDLGDPGAVRDVSTPREALPPYEGPRGPVSGHEHEWGSAVAERPDELG